MKIIIDCKHLNTKAFGILLSKLNLTIEELCMDTYVDLRHTGVDIEIEVIDENE